MFCAYNTEEQKSRYNTTDVDDQGDNTIDRDNWIRSDFHDDGIDKERDQSALPEVSTKSSDLNINDDCSPVINDAFEDDVSSLQTHRIEQFPQFPHTDDSNDESLLIKNADNNKDSISEDPVSDDQKDGATIKESDIEKSKLVNDVVLTLPQNDEQETSETQIINESHENADVSDQENDSSTEKDELGDSQMNDISNQFKKAVEEHRFEDAESLLSQMSSMNIYTPIQLQNMEGDIEYERAQNSINEARDAIGKRRFFDAKQLISGLHEPSDYVRRQIIQRQVRSLEMQIHQSAGDELKLRTFVKNAPIFKFRWCPPGAFKAGSNLSKENPIRSVEIEEGFWILESEVTQPMWEYVMRTKPFRFPSERFQGYYKPQPAENVSYDQCIEFCSRLTKLLDLEDSIVTLPTEEEWEYACCAGHNSSVTKHGRLAAAKGKPSSVKSVSPNEWGIYDMFGNVSEFCLLNADDDDETVPPKNVKHITKGGNWSIEHSSIITPYYREEILGNESDIKTGFRVIIKNCIN